MYHTLRNLFLACAILSLVGCSNAEKELQTKQTAWQATLASLKTTQEGINTKRTELNKLHNTPTEGEGAVAPEELKSQIEALTREIETDANNLKSAAADLIYEVEVWHSENKKANPELAMPPEHSLANRIMSDEDILVAHEYIERQGDYRTAIRILTEASGLDPDYSALKEALAHAEANQYMTEDRLKQVEIGMDENQVKALIGICNTNHIQRYPEKKAMGWFYPREDGGTAGVYFRKDNEKNEVYKVDYDAMKPKSEESAEEEE